jgi:hypothetical protein
VIWEDPDDIGYFFGDPIPEFYPRGLLDECNRMLPEADQWAITQAASLAHQGLHIPAEHCRAMGRYDNVAHFPSVRDDMLSRNYE